MTDAEARRVPRHVAIIMDGNGRWAKARGLPRAAGHQAGARCVKPILEHAARRGIEALTLYSFSSENWRRPADEVDALMSLAHAKLIEERDALVRSNVRFRRIGRRDGLPERVLEQLDATEAATAHCTGIALVLALNYGSRAEIADAARRLAERAIAGAIRPADIDEAVLGAELDTAALPEPDLLVRTAGQMRLSNYLLWQLSYAELMFTDVLWPDFGPAQLDAAIAEFAARERNFGAVPATQSSHPADSRLEAVEGKLDSVRGSPAGEPTSGALT
jgi:undecaprenyl diphosphate synthase